MPSRTKPLIVVDLGPDGRPTTVTTRETKFTKQEADYGPSKVPCEHRCGICEYHLHVPGTHKMECGIVEGEIKDTDGYKLFSVDLIAAAMHPCPKEKN
jgi:hypothetical protein